MDSAGAKKDCSKHHGSDGAGFVERMHAVSRVGDGQGEIAMGYSVSSAILNPSIYFTGRLPGDPVNPANVNSVGFTIADKKAGPFELEIESVKAVAGENPKPAVPVGQPVVDVAGAKPLTPRALIELAIDRGVPLFNADQLAACVAVYEVTCEALRAPILERAKAFREQLTAAEPRQLDALVEFAAQAWRRRAGSSPASGPRRSSCRRPSLRAARGLHARCPRRRCP